jgi:hypothetical protein
VALIAPGKTRKWRQHGNNRQKGSAAAKRSSPHETEYIGLGAGKTSLPGRQAGAKRGDAEAAFFKNSQTFVSE